MEANARRALGEQLRHRREIIFKEVADVEHDLEWIGADRESELEERAQVERAARLLARLDDVGKREIEEIDEALRRISSGAYGICEGCGEEISLPRLQALPMTSVCIECARKAEAEATAWGTPRVPEPATHDPARLPPDLRAMSDPEVEAWLREQIRADGRVDVHELRVVYRHGVAHLEGALPSEAEHQILLGIVQDVAGLQDVVDRLEIRDLLWEREDRAPGIAPSGERPRGSEKEAGSEDVIESIEEGVSYVPPDSPMPEEE
jgi:DnaK suppressor protein